MLPKVVVFRPTQYNTIKQTKIKGLQCNAACRKIVLGAKSQKLINV